MISTGAFIPQACQPFATHPGERVLITGSNGQIGHVLSAALRQAPGVREVVCSDVAKHAAQRQDQAPFEVLNVLDVEALQAVLQKHRIDTVYHLAAVLSARGEADPLTTWHVNVKGLLHILEAARGGLVQRVFFPSTIAVFGPDAPKVGVPDDVPLLPSTAYGMSKVAGENWCAYYHARWGVDVRCLRYPGVVGYEALPGGGGTTDYAVDIFHHVLRDRRYTCFLDATQVLPMIYMPDAIRATLDLMRAPAAQVRRRTGYNIQGMSFAPRDLAEALAQAVGDFDLHYAPDFRQAIALSWPQSLDDRHARADWGWHPRFDLSSMVEDMLAHLRAPSSTI